ncbi:acyltransferase family protein [Salinicoccus hispanicus]|uniref:Acyltransferase family protein n=1 Tax=Salinicoccus hispanicus TaxID=157225 RepID=A0A6N8TZY9_9STAP|nr:acyltransferase [Salinicoccus hispanicus]MXQ51052.1 acyltransferase family protein [Salinicoccus hispanicus]
MSQRRRFTEIDSLRGLAALIVVFYHYTVYYDEKFGHEQWGQIDLFTFGHYGVQLFFIISGFVIYMSLMKVKSVSDFAIKRSIRLYPAYMFAVALTFLIVSLASAESLRTTFPEAMVNLTMLQDFIPAVKNVDGVYWTLRVEMTFYIIMAILLSMGLVKKTMVIAGTWLAASTFIRMMNAALATDLTAFIEKYSMSNYSQMFIIGMMFYCIWQHGGSKRYYGMITLAIGYDFIFEGITNGLFSILFVILFQLILMNRMQWLNSPILLFFGTISYPLYLVHQNIGYVIIYKMESAGFLSITFILVPFLASVLIAYGIHQYIEKPSQNVLLGMYKDKREGYLKHPLIKK